jgi:D-lyxose ketol-isomerase
MNRSEINLAYRQARECFRQHGWALPPNPHWDITDFGLGDFARIGLTLINLANEPEYCEKLMYARKGQTTPAHMHRKKKEDIICRWGELSLWLWPDRVSAQKSADVVERVFPTRSANQRAEAAAAFSVPINSVPVAIDSAVPVVLPAGSRITLIPGVWHAFAPSSEECIIGEVSTANDDAHDNIFLDSNVGRFPGIVEDEPAAIRLVSD